MDVTNIQKLSMALVLRRACLIVFFWGVVGLVGAFATEVKEHQILKGGSKITPESYQQVLDRVERELLALKGLSNSGQDSWVMQERLANTLFERGKLTGDLADFIAAREALQAAFKTASNGAGPFMARASLNYTLHLLPAVEEDLARAESALLVNKPTRKLIRLLRADIDLYRARYQQAKNGYLELETNQPGVDTASRLANYFTQTGNFSEAEHWMNQAESRVVGRSSQLRSWIHLQKGLLDLAAGHLDNALLHYQQALDTFPGHWLIEEHIAEIDALQERDLLAEKKYRNLIDRTNSPLFMVALAELLAERDDEKAQHESATWMQAAAAQFQQQLNMMPEMVSAHALEHFLQFDEIEQVLPLALENYRMRPGGEPAVALVQTLAVAGQRPQAIALLEEILESQYRSAELFATAGVIYQAEHRMDLAQNHYRQALERNPRSIDNLSWFHERVNRQL